MKIDKLPIKIKAVVKQHERNATIAFPLVSFWIGMGYPSRRKSKSPRRYLQMRDNKGICRYFLWTEPDKGKEFISIAHFRKRVKISLEQVKKHYNKTKK